MPSRTVYPDADLAGNFELTQPVPVDGSGYTEPIITAAGTLTYTAEDDSAPAIHASTLTIPSAGAGAEVDDVAYIVSALTDETDLAGTPTAPSIAGTNEVQTLTSTATGGTFTLTHSGNTTAAIASDTATNAQVRTELEGLASIGVGDVTVTGGPFVSGGAGTAIVIEFTGALAESDEALTVTDSSTGGTVTATETVKGVAPASFTLDHAINDPQAGSNGQPQGHVWRRVLVASDLGKAVTVTISDHANNRSVAAVMLIATNPDTTTPTDATGTQAAGNSGNFATFGSITPASSGAKVVTIVAKARAAGYYSGSDPTNPPSGFVSIAEALSDAMTLAVFKSGVVDDTTFTPGAAQWNQSALWATDSFAIRPATAAAGGSTLAGALGAEDLSTWVDMSDAAGSMYEVVELDLSVIPAGAVVTEARLEVAHSCSVREPLRVTLVGINADDTIEPCTEQQSAGYIAVPIGQVSQISTAPWQAVQDGTPLSEFSRLGIALISSTAHPFSEDHRIYWARAVVTYDEGGPVVSNVVGPATAGDPITWDYGSDAGLAQSHYRVMVIAGSAQDPDLATVGANPLDAATGEIVYDSGQVAGVLARSLTLADAPLGRGTHTVAVKAWATSTAGRSISSAWDTADFDITGTPTATGTQSTQPVWNAGTGGVDVTVDVPAGVSRAWLLRSEDSGVTYEIAQDSPYTVTPSTTEVLTDYHAPSLSSTLRYTVTFDTGEMSETGAVEEVGTGSDVSTPGAAWWFRVAADPTLNTEVFVRDYQETELFRSVTAAQDNEPLTATSPPLGVQLDLEIWARSGDERRALLAVLRAGEPIRVSDVHGRVWQMTRSSILNGTPRRSKGNLNTDRPLRDLRVFKVTLTGKAITE